MTAPSRPLRAPLRSNFIWTFVGNATYAAAQWGVLLIVAKLGTPALVGAFSLGSAVTAPVILLANLKLRSVQATDARGEHPFRDYFLLRTITTVAALAVIAVIAIVAYGPGQRGVILAFGAFKAVEAIADVHYGLFQQHERMRLNGFSMVAKGAATLAAVALTLALGGTISAAVVAMAVGAGAVVLLFDVPRCRRLLSERPAPEGRPDWRKIGILAWTALPLGIVVAVGSLVVNVPRYFLEHHVGTSALGIFAALAALMVAGNLVVNALGQAAAPRLAALYAAGDREAFRRLLWKLIGLGAALGAAGLVVLAVGGKPLVRLLYTQEYADYTDVLAWLLVAQGLTYCYVFVGTAINAMRDFRMQLPIHLTSLTVVTAACAILVPAHGLRGAAWAVLAGTMTETALYIGAAQLIYARWKTRSEAGGERAAAGVAEGI
jgi:O-antigen/teichoic acid export membrane protein